MIKIDKFYYKTPKGLVFKIKILNFVDEKIVKQKVLTIMKI